MSENDADLRAADKPLVQGMLLGNAGEPIKLSCLELDGFAGSAASPGQQVEVIHRAAFTSDDAIFHRLADGLADCVHAAGQRDGKGVDIKRASVVLIVMFPDKSAEVWVDTAATAIGIIIKRAVVPGTAVFENDIADIINMSFPAVEIKNDSKVICLFREDWRFALSFDFNPDGALDKEGFEKSLGALLRNMKYRHHYDVVSEQETFSKLIEAGWFPFIDIIGKEFRMLADALSSGLPLAETEEQIIAKFDQDRLAAMMNRWATKPHFSSRQKILDAALRSFIQREPVSVIKIILTEIEGILSDAYFAIHGSRKKIKELLKFAIESAEKRTGSKDTLLFTTAFARYLAEHTFANFDPLGTPAKAGSRHAVGHGQAISESYTMTAALQVLLALDQLSFYT